MDFYVLWTLLFNYFEELWPHLGEGSSACEHEVGSSHPGSSACSLLPPSLAWRLPDVQENWSTWLHKTQPWPHMGSWLSEVFCPRGPDITSEVLGWDFLSGGYAYRGPRGAGAQVRSNTQRLFKVPTLDLLATGQHHGLLSGASQHRPGLVEWALDWESSEGKNLTLAMHLPGCMTLAMSIHA